LSASGDFLASMARASEARVRALLAGTAGGDLERRAREASAPPKLQLAPEGFDVIAELKLGSPSAGILSTDEASIESRAVAYAGAGACAVSVLTEPERFCGHIDHLRRVAATLAPLGLPAMAKDFLVAPEQLFTARIAGAGGALLIVRMLDDARLVEMLDVALELGLFVLLEAFDADDLDRASVLVRQREAAPHGLLLGLNCRDLRTLKVDPSRFADMAAHFPSELPRVAESGIEMPSEAAQVAALGYSIALVGTALMRTEDPAGLLGRMIEQGREANREHE
jgi:indole-3-glycerol phosphate synthase